MNMLEFILQVNGEITNFNAKTGVNADKITIKLIDTDASATEQGIVEYDVDAVGFDENHNILYLEFNKK